MKAITIKAPYAQLIALGLKQYETRKTKVLHSVVGQRIAIHCGKDMREFYDIRSGLTAIPTSDRSVLIGYALQSHDISMFDESIWRQDCGCIIATATVERADIIREGNASQLERECGYWYVGYYAYLLTDVALLDTPISATGKLGLWECGL